MTHRAPSRANHRRKLFWLIPFLPRLIPGPRLPGEDGQPQPHETAVQGAPRPRKAEVVNPKAQKKHIEDNWFALNLEVSAIGLPAFIATIIKLYFTHTVELAPVTAIISQGVLIIPVMILSADAFRRWLKLAKGGRIRTLIRIISLGLSGLSSVTCLLAATLAGVTNMTPQTGESLTSITFWCLVGALPAGFVSVILSNREVSSDEG